MRMERKDGSKPRFQAGGKHKKPIKKIVKFIESLGFEFIKQSNKVHFKHPKRKCSIFFSATPSDTNAIRSILRRLKKDLLNCEPPIDVNSLPSGKMLNQLRLTRGIGSLDPSLSQLDDEPTMGDELDACVEGDFSRISTEISNDAKEDIKTLSERNGMTMGELIEEMLEVYKKNQWEITKSYMGIVDGC